MHSARCSTVARSAICITPAKRDTPALAPSETSQGVQQRRPRGGAVGAWEQQCRPHGPLGLVPNMPGSSSVKAEQDLDDNGIGEWRDARSFTQCQQPSAVDCQQQQQPPPPPPPPPSAQALGVTTRSGGLPPDQRWNSGASQSQSSSGGNSGGGADDQQINSSGTRGGGGKKGCVGVGPVCCHSRSTTE